MRRLAVIVVVVMSVAACGSDDGGDAGAAQQTTVVASGASRAADRLAMSELRNAFAAEKVYFVDHQTYTESLDELRAIEPGLSYAVGAQPSRERTIYLKVAGEQLHLSARSGSGRCFYLRDQIGAETGYAVDTACGPAEGQQYVASW